MRILESLDSFQFLTNPIYLFDVSFQNVEHCFMYAKILDVLYNYSRCMYTKRTNDNVYIYILFLKFLLCLSSISTVLGSRDIITSFVYI